MELHVECDAAAQGAEVWATQPYVRVEAKGDADLYHLRASCAGRGGAIRGGGVGGMN